MAAPIRPAATAALGRRIGGVEGGTGEQATVFVHGFGANHTAWMFNLPFFAERGRVFALDLPGHGGSDLDVGDGTVGFFAELLRAYLDAHGLARPHLVGHSLGGAVVAELARRHPERVASLSRIAPAGIGQAIDPTFVERFPRLRDEQEAHAILSLLVANPRLISRQMVADTLAYVGRPGVSEALETIAAANFPASEKSHTASGAELPGAGTIIWGAEDRVIRPPESIGGSPPALVQKAGHMVHMELSARVNSMLAEVIAAPASRRA